MDLETVHDDSLTDDHHAELDENIYTKLSRSVNPEYLDRARTLTLIVEGYPSLSPAYRVRENAQALLDRYPTLGPWMVLDWGKKGFKHIRRLKILHEAQPVSTQSEEQYYAKAVKDAFAIGYKGDSAILLAEVIDQLHCKADSETYAKVLPIIQSSGMGKSRVADELAKTRLTFQICIREANSNGYPLADAAVREYFVPNLSRDLSPGVLALARTQDLRGAPQLPISHSSDSKPQRPESSPTLEQIYITRVYLFLDALFREGLENLPPVGNLPYQVLARHFYDIFNNPVKRKKFLESVLSRASDTSRWRLGAPRSSLKGKSDDREHWYGKTTVIRSFEEFLKGCCKLCPGEWIGENECPVVISMDEVQVLVEVDVERGKNAFDELCSAIANLKSAKFLVIVLSTASLLSKMAPSRALFPSYRPRGDPKMQLPAPFTEVGFDALAKDVVEENQLDLHGVTRFKFVSKFGRPMWSSLLRTLRGDLREDTIIEFAEEKLVGVTKPYFYRLPFESSIAAISVRLLLDMGPAREIARALEENLVRSHMRVAFSMPEHREYMRTGTPSEPLLAEAAARVMNSRQVDVLDSLGYFFTNGFGPRGERKELVGRLLDILAIDSAIQEMRSTELLKYSQPISVLAYLKNLLPEKRWDIIKRSLPSNPHDIEEKFRTMPLEDAFADAWVHVTHYAMAGDSSVLQSESLWAYWARGMAFQLRPGQVLSDRALPIYWSSFQHWDRVKRDLPMDVDALKLGRNTCSAILHQDKNSATVSPCSIRPQKAKHLEMFKVVDAKPVIAFTHIYDYAGPPEVTVVAPPSPPFRPPTGEKPDAPLYQIFIRGLHEDNYRPIKTGQREAFMGLLGSDYHDHARFNNPETVDALRRLKPDHTLNPASREWFE